MKIKLNLSGQDVVLNVPDGMDPLSYAEEVENRHYAQEKPSAASDSALENFTAGVGQGAVNIGRQVGNILPGNLQMVTDEELGQAKKLDEDLLGTTSGKVGSIIGEITATAPIGAGAGRALGAASRASRAGSVLARTLAHPATAAAVDSAATGALVAGPGERGQGALTGAVTSGLMSGAGSVLKRTLTKPWVSKTPEAIATEARTGREIPLSQSAEQGIWKQIYEGVVANIPGAGGKLRKQYDDALQDFREYVVEEATPPGVDRIPIVGSHNMHDIMKRLREAWDAKYASFDVNNAPIKIFPGEWDVPRALKSRLAQGVRLPKEGDVLPAHQLFGLKENIQDVINELPDKEKVLRSQFIEFKDSIDALIKGNINPTGRSKSQWAKELAERESLAPYYKRFKDIQAAASKVAKNAEFTPEQLAAASARRAGAKGIEGGGAFADEAKDAMEALKPFPSRQGVFQTLAALSIGAAATGGGIVGGPAGVALGAAAPIVLGKTLASRRVQRALTGDLPSQKVLKKALDKTGKVLDKAKIPQAVRKALVIGAAE